MTNIKFELNNQFRGATYCCLKKTITMRDDNIDDDHQIAAQLAHEFAHALNADKSYHCAISIVEQKCHDEKGIEWHIVGTIPSEEKPIHVLRTLITEKRAWRYALSLFPGAYYHRSLSTYQK